MPLDEQREPFRLLEGRQILALEILDQRDLERVVCGADEGRELVDARELRRAEATLAGEQLVAVLQAPDDDRLQQTSRLDRIRELGELVRREVLARLIGIRLDVGEHDRRQHGALVSLDRPRERQASHRGAAGRRLGFRHAPPHPPPPRSPVVLPGAFH